MNIVIFLNNTSSHFCKLAKMKGLFLKIMAQGANHWQVHYNELSNIEFKSSMSFLNIGKMESFIAW